MDDVAHDLSAAILNLDAALKSMTHEQIAAVVTGFANNEDTHTILSSMLVNANIRYRNGDLLHNAAFGTEPDGIDLTSVSMPVGLVSNDGSAILGRDGFVFLTGGSNDVIGQYSPRRTGDDELFAQWMNVIAARLDAAERAKVRFHQIVIPEKISILPELFPRPVAAPTRLLDLLESECLTRYGRTMHTSARHLFWALPDRRRVSKRTDSHLSPFGSAVVFREIVRQLYGLKLPEFAFTEAKMAVGDLAYRMFGLFLPEIFSEVDSATMPAFVQSATKVFEAVPSHGAHMGRRQVWRNPEAPIREKVVVFGNSFFSFVENGQSNLSWWFSRWFEEYHFVWTNEVHWNYVAEVDPQLVIWQGIERFLPILPAQ
ncbi:hypothetical protein [Methylobacterium sp. ID0610]|uniref:hypothetical protein n=1 Tax=Methylobacterium carpenticola TaxID=3344827 RepID=UPI0036CB0D7C